MTRIALARLSLRLLQAIRWHVQTPTPVETFPWRPCRRYAPVPRRTRHAARATLCSASHRTVDALVRLPPPRFGEVEGFELLFVLLLDRPPVLWRRHLLVGFIDAGIGAVVERGAVSVSLGEGGCVGGAGRGVAREGLLEALAEGHRGRFEC